MPADPETVCYCLVGVGYFGTRSLRSFIQLLPYIEGGSDRDAPSARIFAVVDANPTRVREVRQALEALDLGTGVLYFSNIDELMKGIAREATIDAALDHATFVIHDCSATETHFPNLVEISTFLQKVDALSERVILLTEKPAITSYQYTKETPDAITDALFPGSLCDYIETQSLTFIAFLDWARSHDFHPNQHWVWRCGSTGFKKLFEGGRDGVTGGALEDKAAHDLAIICGLYGLPNQVAVHSAQVDSLLLADHEKTYGDSHSTWATADARTTSSLANENGYLRGDLADIRVAASIDWETSEKQSIPIFLHFAWDGVEDTPSLLEHPCVRFLKQNAADMYPIVATSERSWVAGQSAKSYVIGEARLHLIDFESDGRNGTAALSFLGTKLPGGRSWAAIVWDDGAIEDIPLPANLRGGDNSLLRVLEAVSGRSDEEKLLRLDRDVTHLVGQVCGDIRRFVAENQPAPADTHIYGIETYERMVQRSRALTRPVLRYFIFDLDGTLANTPEIDPTFVSPVLDAIEACGRRSANDLDSIRERLLYLAIDHPDHGLEPDELDAATAVFRDLRVEDPTEIGFKLYGRFGFQRGVTVSSRSQLGWPV